MASLNKPSALSVELSRTGLKGSFTPNPTLQIMLRVMNFKQSSRTTVRTNSGDEEFRECSSSRYCTISLACGIAPFNQMLRGITAMMDPLRALGLLLVTKGL
jgi:hypothetical protein